MKISYGYSIIELILFLCISGILVFLAIPFLKSFSNTSPIEANDAFTVDVDSGTPSNSPQNLKDSNQTTSLPTAD